MFGSVFKPIQNRGVKNGNEMTILEMDFDHNLCKNEIKLANKVLTCA